MSRLSVPSSLLQNAQWQPMAYEADSIAAQLSGTMLVGPRFHLPSAPIVVSAKPRSGKPSWRSGVPSKHSRAGAGHVLYDSQPQRKRKEKSVQATGRMH
eukprot:1146433-Pelagomonas_calceolata.AAC.8